MRDDSAPKKARIQRPSYLGGPSTARRPGGQAADSSRSAGRVPEQSSSGARDGADKAAEQRQEAAEDKEIYSWKVWLLPRRPLVSVAVVLTLVFSIWLAYWAFPNSFFIAVISVLLINRLAPYLFPVKYVLREQTVGYTTFLARDIRPWSRFITYYKFKDGVLLSHDTRTIRGRFTEGLFLHYADDLSNKDQVLSVVESRLKPPQEALGPRDDKAYKGGIGSAFRRIRNLSKKSGGRDGGQNEG